MKSDERAVRDQVQRNVTPVIPRTLDFADRQRLENAAANERRRIEEKRK
jgi:hypothetical protein